MYRALCRRGQRQVTLDRRSLWPKLVACSAMFHPAHCLAWRVFRITRRTALGVPLHLNSLNRRKRIRVCGGVGGLGRAIPSLTRSLGKCNDSLARALEDPDFTGEAGPQRVALCLEYRSESAAPTDEDGSPRRLQAGDDAHPCGWRRAEGMERREGPNAYGGGSTPGAPRAALHPARSRAAYEPDQRTARESGHSPRADSGTAGASRARSAVGWDASARAPVRAQLNARLGGAVHRSRTAALLRFERALAVRVEVGRCLPSKRGEDSHGKGPSICSIRDGNDASIFRRVRLSRG